MESTYGIVASILGVIGAAAYIQDTYTKKTKPHRIAWFIFLVISVISFASQYALGAQASLFFAGWFICNNVIIFSLSLRKGGGYGGVTKSNILGLGLALLGIVLWVTLTSPLAALICVLIAEIIGVIMIVVKAYRYPESETALMWTLGIVASVFNLAAVGTYEFALVLFPLYLCIANIAIVLAIMLGKRRT